MGEGPDVAVACGTEVEQPFAALQDGAGARRRAGAPTFSDYDLFRTGYSNAEFVAAIMEWLCGGWPEDERKEARRKLVRDTLEA